MSRGSRRWLVSIVVATCLVLGDVTPVAMAARAATTPVAIDEAGSAGIGESTRSWGAAVTDVNNDGWPDFLLSRHSQGSAQLFVNDTLGRFVEQDPGTFSTWQERLGCSAGDVNQDGRPDFACSIGAEHGTGLKADELWIQGADGTFIDQARSEGVEDPYGRGRGITLLDVNGDGYADLFVQDVGERPDGLPSSNRLYLNAGGTSFVRAPQFGLDGTGGSAEAFDFNGDGWIDLLLSTSDGQLRLYENVQGTRFVDVSASVGLGAGDTGAVGRLADLNGDGTPDLIEVFAHKLVVKVQSAETFQQVFTMPLTAGRAAAAGDVNGDGKADLYILQDSTSSNTPDLMLLNDGTGTSFSSMAIPETSTGHGDAVSPLDYDHNGLTDFLVLNGHGISSGLLQLIAFFPPGPAVARPAPASVPPDRLAAAPAGAPGPPTRSRGLGSLSSPVSAGCTAGWNDVSAPQPGDSRNGMEGLGALGATDVWAVGHEITSGQPSLAPAIEHWDGRAWSLVGGPNLGSGDAGLNGVSGASSIDVWAVGFSSPQGTGDGYTPVAEHWNGTTWALSSLPNTYAASASLVGVNALSSTDVWAVGYTSNGGVLSTLAEHWDGSQWSEVPSPHVGSDDNGFVSLSAVSSTDAWAVGWYRAASGLLETLTEHWDGSRWSIVASPNGDDGTGVLDAVRAVSSTDVWAVGVTEDPFPMTLAEHWSGTAWTIEPTPNPSSSFNAFRGLAVAGAGDVWAVGAEFDASAGSHQSMTQHWDGSGWTLAPTPAGDDREMVAAVAAPGQLWGTGWSDHQDTLFMDRNCPIQVLDSGFAPRTGHASQGGGVGWSVAFTDTEGHSVTDGSGMGLFDSGIRSPGSSFVFVYVGAGTYPVTDAATGKGGSIAIPVAAVPLTGSLGTTFTVTWSSAPAPSGFSSTSRSGDRTRPVGCHG